MAIRHFWNIFSGSFNPCFFVGLLMLSIFGHLTTQEGYKAIKESYWFFFLPVLIGLLSVVAIYFLHSYLLHLKYLTVHPKKEQLKLLLTAFIAGCFSVYIGTKFGTFFIGGIIIYFTFRQVKRFSQRMVKLLRAGSVATAHDVAVFLNFFINLIITFSVVNLVLHVIQNRFSSAQGFNFGESISSICDTFYFTVVTMTTVGYGDITPQTHMAHIVVILECLTSYVMFGLMIGIISRGIRFEKKDTKKMLSSHKINKK